MIGWSDNGEFGSTGFIQGLAQIEKEMDINIFWNHTASQHGKRSADAFGHHDKTAMRQGVMARTLNFSEKAEHVETARKFMNSKDDEYRLNNYEKTNPRKLRKMNYYAITEIQ